MTKWAIYETDYGGKYAKEYIDDIEDCEKLPFSSYIKEEDLPIVVNSVGGRCMFSEDDEGFLEIVELEKGKRPLTRNEMYPKNYKGFNCGWIDLDGNTYSCGYSSHYDCAEELCEELGYRGFNPEKVLEDKGWLKITIPRLAHEMKVLAMNMYITKKQADTLFDIGLYNDRDVQFLIECSKGRW